MSDLRSEVEAAFDKVAADSPEPIEIEDVPVAEVVEHEEPAPEGDETAADAGDGVTPAAKVPDTQAKTPEADAPPSGWKAEEKAAWNKVPPELKQAILRREKEAAQLATRALPNKEFADTINRTIQPYSAMLQKHNLNAVAVMQEGLQLAHALQAGTPEQKAETLGKMIMHFGVDIQALDAFLVDPKNTRRPSAQTQTYDPKADPRLSPLFSLADQIEAKTVEVAKQQVDSATAWPGFEEARDAMADLIEWHDSRGQKMTLAQAYSRVTGNAAPVGSAAPSGSVTRIPTAKNVSQAAAILAKSRKAASSVVGNRRTAPAVNTDDIRATVAAAASGLL